MAGAEAQEIGLCSRLVDAAALRETALETADGIARSAPLLKPSGSKSAP